MKSINNRTNIAQRRGNALRLFLVSTAGGLALAGAAQAAELEEVVVTARKQAEKLQDVPVTVNALSANAIDKLQIKSLFDLAQVTPGVYFGTSGGRNGGNKLQIRNFSTGTAGPSKASVFIDGQYIPGDYASIPMANLERVEVLKGPQSAYFGRATEVGAVNFITRDPANEFTGNLDFLHATEGEHDYTGYVSFPIVKDKLAQQITYRHYAFKGPDEWRTRDGYHLGDQSTKAITFKTLFTPTENLRLKFLYTHVEDKDHAPPVLYSDPARRVAIPRPGGTFGYYYNGATDYDFAFPNWGLPTSALTNPGIRHKQDRFSLSYDWTIASHTISGYLSHSEEKFNEQLDGSFTLSGSSPMVLPNAFGVPVSNTFAPNFLNYYLQDEDTQFEFRVTSPQEQRLRYTFGVNYSKIDGKTRLDNLAGATIFFSNQYGGSFLNPATNKSVFGGLYLDVTSNITVSVEGRYKREVIRAKTYSPAPATFGQTLTDVSAEYKSFLPRVNVQYRVNPNLQFYALYSEGDNPGGFQPITPAQAAANNVSYNYAEERIKNYEAGVKSTWLDGRLIFNAAVFHMDFTNEQLAQTAPIAGTPTGFASIYQPGVTSKATGFEAEANAAVTDDLQIRATIGYGKAEYVNFCSAPYGALTGIHTGLNCRSVNGKQQEGTPALQTSLSGDYTHEINDTWSFYLRGDWQYQSKVYNEEWDQSWIPAFSMFNARVGIQNDNWTLEAFGRNLTDDDHTTRSTRVTDGRTAASAASYPTLNGFSQVIAGQQNVAGTAKKPRQFGVRIAYQF